MEFFFNIRKRDFDTKIPQCLLVCGFPLHIEQGVTDVEPDK
jgi:hypothetical protein